MTRSGDTFTRRSGKPDGVKWRSRMAGPRVAHALTTGRAASAATTVRLETRFMQLLPLCCGMIGELRL
jgi:hypothetical protein